MTQTELTLPDRVPAKKQVRSGTPAGARKRKTLRAVEILKRALAKLTKPTKPLVVLNVYAAELDYRHLTRVGLDIEEPVRFENNDVHVFTLDELQLLLEKGGLYVSKRVPSRTEGVEWIWLKGAPKLAAGLLHRLGIATDLSGLPHVTATIDSGNGDESDYAYLTAALLYPFIKRPIKLRVPHGVRADYCPDGPFQIYIWSSPGGLGKQGKPPVRVWGIKTCCRDEAFIPTGIAVPPGGGKTHTGIALRDGAYAVAELFPNALYVHHDLVHYGDLAELELYAELLKRCQPLVARPEALAVYLAEAERERIEAERLTFQRLIERSIEKRAERHKNAVEAAKRLVDTTKRVYFEAERKLFAERQALLDPDVVRKRFITEYEKLASGKVPLIQGVTLDLKKEGRVTIHTGEITIEHPRDGTTRLIGGCDATYNLETGDVVSIVNRDRQPRARGMTYHTPHVFYEDGHFVCLGAIEAELAAYIAHYEIEAAAVLTVAFLQSVRNDGQYLRFLELFPIVKK